MVTETMVVAVKIGMDSRDILRIKSIRSGHKYGAKGMGVT